MNAPLVDKRRNYIDLLKGISILTLIFLHFEEGVLPSHPTFFIVRSPAFYFLVGWLWGMSSKKRTIREHIEKRRKTLILPYIWFSLIFLAFDLLLFALDYIDQTIIYRDIYKTLVLRGIGTLWFLPALLGGEIITIFMRDKKIKYQIAGIAVSCGLIMLYRYWQVNFKESHEIIDAPLYVINTVLHAWIITFAAYQLSSRFSKKLNNMSRQKLLLIAVIGLGISFVTFNYVEVTMDTYSWEIVGYIFLINIVGLLGALCLCMVIENYIVVRPIIYCGKNSLILMVTHYTILLQLFQLFDKHYLGHEHFSGYITIVYFAIAMVLEYFIITFINSKAKFLIGK